MSVPGLVEHFFRHEYGRLVAILSSRQGYQHLADIEDAVQSALMTALQTWSTAGLPDNPPAWLFRVAQNNLLGELRRRSRRERILEAQGADDLVATESVKEEVSARESQDALLQMLFACCDDAIPADSQLVLALRTLCGFAPREIAGRIFSTEANVYKRLERARRQLQQLSFRLVDLTPAQEIARLPTVQRILYALFTEGYLSSREDAVIRRELCDEAVRLATLLATHRTGGKPETFALLALMHFHRARLAARLDRTGGLLLLEEQDRGLLDANDVRAGFVWLAESAQGERFSRYHAEAAIAAEHCRAATYRDICWEKIAECYALLEQTTPSALHRLNRAVAVAEWRSPAEGLAILKGFEPPGWLAGSYMWAAVLADLHRRNGDSESAERYASTALQLAPTEKVRRLLAKRLTTTGSRTASPTIDPVSYATARPVIGARGLTQGAPGDPSDCCS